MDIGFASELAGATSDCTADTRVLQFAQWLARQPHASLEHMLGLTFFDSCRADLTVARQGTATWNHWRACMKNENGTDQQPMPQPAAIQLSSVEDHSERRARAAATSRYLQAMRASSNDAAAKTKLVEIPLAPTTLTADAAARPHASMMQTARQPSAAACTLSRGALQEVARELVGSEVSSDAPLMQAGLDSLGATEFRSRLSQRLGAGADLPETLIFDFPTLRQIEEHVASSAAPPMAPACGEDSSAVLSQQLLTMLGSGGLNTRPADSQAQDVHVTGLAFSGPSGAKAAGPAWHATTAGQPLIGEVPFQRWDVNSLPAAADALTSRRRHGGFVDTAFCFDLVAFAISAAEAAVMDPQQRIMLEGGYDALRASGWDRAKLLSNLTGIFIGVTFLAFEEELLTSPLGSTVYAGTGSALSVISGRLSYVLGLHGPCLSIDTACSAAIVSCHAASRAMQKNECNHAMAAGVNLMLSATPGSRFALAGMTSPHGRCFTFDARADGYARAEACCGVALASSESNGVALGGSSVRQDGRSASLTAPNGQAQQGLLGAAISDAGLSPGSVGVSEAHGTGTALGDPIETGSLVGAVVRPAGRTDSKLALGAGKANSGHAEPAAGASGLLKLALQLAHGKVAPNAQLHVLNPHIIDAMRGVECVVPRVVQAASTMSRIGVAAGVSSFGYSGTIAHTVLTLRAIMLWGLEASTCTMMWRRSFAWREDARPLVLEPALGTRVTDTAGLIEWQREMSAAERNFHCGHQIGFVPLIAGTSYIEAVRAATYAARGRVPFRIDAAKFHTFLFIDDDLVTTRLKTLLDPHTDVITISSQQEEHLGWTEHAEMRARPHRFASIKLLDAETCQKQYSRHVSHSEFYTAIGNNYQGEFRSAHESWVQPAEFVLSRIEFVDTRTAPFLRAGAWLDACNHTAILLSQPEARTSSCCIAEELRGQPYYAASIEAYDIRTIDSLQTRVMWGSHMRGSHEFNECASLYNERRECVVQIHGGTMGTFARRYLELQRLQRHLYIVDWVETQPEEAAADVRVLITAARTPRVDAALAATAASTVSVGNTVVQDVAAIAFVVWVGGGCGLEGLSGAAAALGCFQAAAAASSTLNVWLVQARTPSSVDTTGVLGLVRSARAEGKLRISCYCDEGRHLHMHAGRRNNVWGALGRQSAHDELELASGSGLNRIPRLAGAVRRAMALTKARLDAGPHLLSGGLGGLGMITGRWLASQGASELLLVSRRGGQGSFGAVDWRRPDGTEVQLQLTACDLSQSSDARHLAVSVALPVCGLWHLAGTLADGLLANQSAAALCRVFASKALAASLIQTMCNRFELHVCVLFSSVASLLGTAGQASYSAANTCLDVLAVRRRAFGHCGVSVQWGPWAEAGMGTDAAAIRRLHVLGFAQVQTYEGLTALERVSCFACSPVLAVLPMSWAVYLGRERRVPLFLEGVAPPALTRPVTRINAPNASVQEISMSLEQVLLLVCRTAGGTIDADASLMEAGVDSLGAVELRNQLQSADAGISVPSTLLFEFPTARQIATLFASRPAVGPADAQLMAPSQTPRAPSTQPSNLPPLLDQEALDERLVLLRAGSSGHCPIFALHMPDGLCSLFLGLGRVLRRSHMVIGVEHGVVRTGDPKYTRDVGLEELALEYAELIMHTCTTRAFAALHLIGASAGAALAYSAACGIEQAGALLRTIILIDPPPPAVKVVLSGAEACHTHLEWRRFAASTLLMRSSIVMRQAISPEQAMALFSSAQSDEVDLTFAVQLTRLGMAPESMSTVIESRRRLDAWVHTALLLSQPPRGAVKAVTRTLLVLASERGKFFGTGASSSELGAYFATSPLLVDGEHLAVLAKVTSGEEPRFTDALNAWLEEICSTTYHSG